MAKTTIHYICPECGYDTPQWLGKCPECGIWNSFKEFRVNNTVEKYAKGMQRNVSAPAKKISQITNTPTIRMNTGFQEMDTVLGGGIVNGSVTLIAGDPGIGKSTLLLQLCMLIANTGKKVLYISSEESEEQISIRAQRLDPHLYDNIFLVSLSDTDTIISIIEEEKPSLVIVDSIQTIQSQNLPGLSGSVAQIRYACSGLVTVAKGSNIPIFIVGHVTKEGMVAGPMMLAHMVDTVLFLEGEKFTKTRLLRSFKNRFGPIDEVGIFLMEEKGMIEIKNPEQVFLSQAPQDIPGSVLTVILEGTRPFLLEIQALVIASKLPIPRRVGVGIDGKRLELLLAVLQKHCQLSLDTKDVFVNIAGGVKVQDRAVDLSISLAIYSSLTNKVIGKTVVIGEVGLLGELREVPALEKRIKEAKKLGFEHIISSRTAKSLPEVLHTL